MFISSPKSWLENSEETLLFLSLENGKIMIWLDIKLQLEDLLTTSVHHKASMIFKETQLMLLSTLSLFSLPVLSSLESGLMYLDQAQEMLLDNSWIKN